MRFHVPGKITGQAKIATQVAHKSEKLFFFFASSLFRMHVNQLKFKLSNVTREIYIDVYIQSTLLEL